MGNDLPVLRRRRWLAPPDEGASRLRSAFPCPSGIFSPRGEEGARPDIPAQKTSYPNAMIPPILERQASEQRKLHATAVRRHEKIVTQAEAATVKIEPLDRHVEAPGDLPGIGTF